jgi:4-hydroxybenzoate polyprenyltransferase
MAALVSFSLWRYSTRWKAAPLLGNTIVAALLGLVPVWLAALEAPFTPESDRFSLWLGMAAYGSIATGIGMVRELAKDAMDIRGDQEAGKITFAVSKGPGATRAVCIGLLSMVAVMYSMGIAWVSPPESLLLWMAPLPFWVWSMTAVLSKEQKWRKLSRATLWTLLAGTLQCLWIPC